MTFGWWLGDDDDPDKDHDDDWAVFHEYDAYIKSVAHAVSTRVPAELLSPRYLHDAELRSWPQFEMLLPQREEARFEFLGCDRHPPGEVGVDVLYLGVSAMSVVKRASTNYHPVALGYHEIYLNGDDTIEHTLLFNTGLEIAVTCRSITVTTDPPDAPAWDEPK